MNSIAISRTIHHSPECLRTSAFNAIAPKPGGRHILLNPVYRPSGPLGLNYALGNRGLRPRQRLYQPSGLRTARSGSPVEIRPSSGSPVEIQPSSGSPVEIRLFSFSPAGGTSLPLVRKPPENRQTFYAAHQAKVVSSVEPLSPMALHDAPAEASYGCLSY